MSVNAKIGGFYFLTFGTNGLRPKTRSALCAIKMHLNASQCCVAQYVNTCIVHLHMKEAAKTFKNQKLI